MTRLVKAGGAPRRAVTRLVQRVYDDYIKSFILFLFVTRLVTNPSDNISKEINDMEILIMGAAVVVMVQVLFLILEESKR